MAEQRPADFSSFERRKQDHIRLAMDPRTQATGAAGFDFVRLTHEALPDLNFSEVSLQTQILGVVCQSPFFISSMTAGHSDGEKINLRLARLSDQKQILMGVGSQRKELTDPSASQEWKQIRKEAPKAHFLGNLGIAQIIQTPVSEIQRLVDTLEARGLFVHLNPLQECLQLEGTPQFKGGLSALEKLVKSLSVPVIVKEVGCGLSASTLKRLSAAGVQYVDISGLGGTHWGRLEGLRASEKSPSFQAAQVFKNWGLPTLESLLEAREIFDRSQIFASGGVRSGLDAAKLLAMGASAVGVAKPFLEGALQSDEVLWDVLEQFELELKIALFCTGSGTLAELQQKKVWTWN
ncbi:MAG: type 2 isopentenyl-diphosphate Delta-isomerase [Pseudobdellovibrionaceae bacterium]